MALFFKISPVRRNAEKEKKKQEAGDKIEEVWKNISCGSKPLIFIYKGALFHFADRRLVT